MSRVGPSAFRLAALLDPPRRRRAVGSTPVEQADARGGEADQGSSRGGLRRPSDPELRAATSSKEGTMKRLFLIGLAASLASVVLVGVQASAGNSPPPTLTPAQIA